MRDIVASSNDNDNNMKKQGGYYYLLNSYMKKIFRVQQWEGGAGIQSYIADFQASMMKSSTRRLWPIDSVQVLAASYKLHIVSCQGITVYIDFVE